ncbi:NUDIX domain-containing protein [Micromonospora zamorensis]|uniref:NUDIX domain-containing protein n=1 Tax=Micromonospora zamorensis TaxID=709883 RepID=UPI0033B9EC2B
MLITDDDERVLLVEPTYKAQWEIPGGCVDADESPYQAAFRACRKELALDLTPGGLLVLDRVPPHDGRPDGVMVANASGETCGERGGMAGAGEPQRPSRPVLARWS